jgi:ABC-type multidrug transport system fused ATPase/permease subunit
VLSFGQQRIDMVIKRYFKLLREPVKNRIRSIHIAGLSYGYSLSIRYIYLCLIFYIASAVSGSGEMPSTFKSITILFIAFLSVSFSFSQLPSPSVGLSVSYKIFSIIDDVQTSRKSLENGGEERPSKLSNSPPSITFKSVTFRHKGQTNPLLRNFSMHVPAGKKVAIVGHPGCGKSTLAGLIMRFYELDKGEILINERQSVNHYDTAALRKKIGFVMQDPILFSATIRENIVFGDREASDAKVR